MAKNSNSGCLTIIVIFLLLWCCTSQNKVDKEEVENTEPSLEFNYQE